MASVSQQFIDTMEPGSTVTLCEYRDGTEGTHLKLVCCRFDIAGDESYREHEFYFGICGRVSNQVGGFSVVRVRGSVYPNIYRKFASYVDELTAAKLASLCSESED